MVTIKVAPSDLLRTIAELTRDGKIVMVSRQRGEHVTIHIVCDITPDLDQLVEERAHEIADELIESRVNAAIQQRLREVIPSPLAFLRAPWRRLSFARASK